jgi:hypothetical protein
MIFTGIKVTDKYGVLICTTGACYVGNTPDNVSFCKDAKELREKAEKERKIIFNPRRPIFEQIADKERLKDFCRDEKIDNYVDFRKTIEGMRDEIRAHLSKT